jgi:hypothetical protein
MTVLAAGLLASLALYMAAIGAFVSVGSRHIQRAEEQGVALGPRPDFPAWRAIWRRHGIETPIIFGVFFGVLALAGFPLWQRIGIVVSLALVFGSSWVSKSETWSSLARGKSLRHRVMAAEYWCLSVLDWLGYLGVVCFASSIVVGGGF